MQTYFHLEDDLILIKNDLSQSGKPGAQSQRLPKKFSPPKKSVSGIDLETQMSLGASDQAGKTQNQCDSKPSSALCLGAGFLAVRFPPPKGKD